MIHQNLKTTFYFHFLLRRKIDPHMQLLLKKQELQQLTAQIMRIQAATLQAILGPILHELLQKNAKKLFCLVSTIIYRKKFTSINFLNFVPPPGCFLSLLLTSNNMQ